ncbi:MAG TPA: right-handed parallel beta-helix repeat-containing protein [Rudaea sp.]|nr:right-handed parallel beta-helix repeat-containing protein [Rudaea sp.]
MDLASRSVPTLASARRTSLAAALAALCTCVPFDAGATTWPVSSCADGGSGTLRSAVAAAASGDTVDLSSLACSRISLTTGAIVIPQNDLTLQGPAAGVEITGNSNGTIEADRVLYHSGTGTLGVRDLAITYGKLDTGGAEGGCIYSAGSVFLYRSRVSACLAQSPAGTPSAVGGGLHVAKNLIAKYSTIDDNLVTGGSPLGGGAFVTGEFIAYYSTVSDNIAVGTGGGVVAYQGAVITNSTISANSAGFDGGLLVRGNPLTAHVQIVNSTISGNAATGFGAQAGTVGGIEIRSLPTTVQYSTIAFNTAGAGKVPGAFVGYYYRAPGLVLVALPSDSFTATLQSVLLSNNTYGTTEADFSTAGTGTITVSSANNLIRASTGPQKPGTVSVQCPLLGPLRDNGGPTKTHALQSGSPAIDAGGTAATPTTDQRGAPYTRRSGTNADIGAYEVQKADRVFSAGFDGCPALL